MFLTENNKNVLISNENYLWKYVNNSLYSITILIDKKSQLKVNYDLK